jgi:hypothetical protein
MTTETLPLFDQLPDDPAALRRTSGRTSEATSEGNGGRTGRAAARAPQVDAHLRAARKLSKQIRRTVDGSPQQTKAAHLICQHLLAMLHTNGVDRTPAQGTRHKAQGTRIERQLRR